VLETSGKRGVKKRECRNKSIKKKGVGRRKSWAQRQGLLTQRLTVFSKWVDEKRVSVRNKEE